MGVMEAETVENNSVCVCVYDVVVEKCVCMRKTIRDTREMCHYVYFI